MSVETSSASLLNLARIPTWPRLHHLGAQVQSPHWETCGVNKSRSWASASRYPHSGGETPQHSHKVAAQQLLYLAIMPWFFFFLSPIESFLRFTLTFPSCCCWSPRSLRASTMPCCCAPRSPRPRKWTWIAPSCPTEPSSPPSQPSSPD